MAYGTNKLIERTHRVLIDTNTLIYVADAGLTEKLGTAMEQRGLSLMVTMPLAQEILLNDQWHPGLRQTADTLRAGLPIFHQWRMQFEKAADAHVRGREHALVGLCVEDSDMVLASDSVLPDFYAEVQKEVDRQKAEWKAVFRRGHAKAKEEGWLDKHERDPFVRRNLFGGLTGSVHHSMVPKEHKGMYLYRFWKTLPEFWNPLASYWLLSIFMHGFQSQGYGLGKGKTTGFPDVEHACFAPFADRFVTNDRPLHAIMSHQARLGYIESDVLMKPVEFGKWIGVPEIKWDFDAPNGGF